MGMALTTRQRDELDAARRVLTFHPCQTDAVYVEARRLVDRHEIATQIAEERYFGGEDN